MQILPNLRQFVDEFGNKLVPQLDPFIRYRSNAIVRGVYILQSLRPECLTIGLTLNQTRNGPVGHFNFSEIINPLS